MKGAAPDQRPSSSRDERAVRNTETGGLAAPAGSPRAAIAVLHAWWGLTPVITGVCDDLAELGYVAVAPDLYRGVVATSAQEAAAPVTSGRTRLELRC